MNGRARANGEGSIFPYRNGYAAYAWVTKPNGTRDRKYVYGQTREIVHEKWIKLQQQAKEQPMASTSMTVTEYFDYWLTEVIKPNSAPLTHATYESHTRLYIVPGLGKRKLSWLQLHQRDVQKWINQVAATCQCCAQEKDARRREHKRRCCGLRPKVCCEQYLAARSISDIRTCFRSALSDAIEAELITKNVGVNLKLPKVRKPKRKRWSSDEACRFLQSAYEDDDPLYAGYVLVLVQAMRKGEVLGLPDDHVDETASEIDVSYQLQRVGGQLLHRDTKTEDSEATIPLADIALEAIRHRRTRRAADKAAAGDAWHETGLLITTRYGTPIEPRNFNRSWNARCDKAGVKRITVQDGRRTCGSLLADLDVHPRVAMQILRHAQFAITMEIYTQVSSEATRAALKKLSERLKG